MNITQANEYSNNKLSVVEDSLFTPIETTAAYMLLNNNEMIGSYAKEIRIQSTPIELSTQESINNYDFTTNGIFVVPDTLLTSENLQLFEEKQVKGIIFYTPRNNTNENNNNNTNEYYHYQSQDKQSSFNPKGNGIAWKKYTYPILYTFVDKSILLQKGKDLQIEMDMYADSNSEVCLRRDMCMAIGGYSFYGSLGNTTNNESILLTSRLDGTSFFRDITPAHEEVLSGETILLSVLETLRPVIEKAKKNVHYAFFEGETFGSMGSSRYASIQDNYTHIFHFGPLGLTNGEVYVYSNSSSSLPSDSSKRIVFMKNEKRPNCSLDSFKHGEKIYIADHKETFKGNISTHQDYLKSLNDLCENVQSITEMILQVIFDTTDLNQLQNEININYKCDNFTQLFDCLAYNVSCTYFNQTIGSFSGFSNGYPSVYQSGRLTIRNKVISDYLIYITTLNNCKENCTSLMNGTMNYLSTFSDDIEFGTFSTSVTNNKGNAWTESTWSMIQLSSFTPRTTVDYVIVSIGFVCMILITIFTLIFLNKLGV